MKNDVTLTEPTLDAMRKYKRVEVTIAIVGTELRGPEVSIIIIIIIIIIRCKTSRIYHLKYISEMPHLGKF